MGERDRYEPVPGTGLTHRMSGNCVAKAHADDQAPAAVQLSLEEENLFMCVVGNVYVCTVWRFVASVRSTLMLDLLEPLREVVPI